MLCVVECATDNTTRTVANVRSYFNKAGGELLKTGQLEYMFTRKAVFQIEIPAGMSKDDLELELIDAGLEEIEETEDGTFAYSDWTSYGTMHEALENMKVNIVKANLQRFANNPVAFNDEQIESIMNFLDKVEDDEDVQAVYTNME